MLNQLHQVGHSGHHQHLVNQVSDRLQRQHSDLVQARPLPELGVDLDSRRESKYQKDGHGMILGAACYLQWLVVEKGANWMMSW
jgi:hypothetical protein